MKREASTELTVHLVLAYSLPTLLRSRCAHHTMTRMQELRVSGVLCCLLSHSQACLWPHRAGGPPTIPTIQGIIHHETSGSVSSGDPSHTVLSINYLWYHRKYYLAQEQPSGFFPQCPRGRSTIPPKTPKSTKMVSYYFLKGIFYQGECPMALSTSGHQLQNWQEWPQKYCSCIFLLP